MKRTVIGGFIMMAGLLTTLTIILVAALYVPSINSWSGSKLWYAIFGAKRYGNEVVDSLFLGFPFIVGLLLAILGLVILVMEYFDKSLVK
ncbi:hypothetical protein [Sporosarcina sp. YIM B06819]|uniref:hypothetical protein n=1 Tax=Sporosarcina sp. YIM B06819 TaxID=3081769 RepID=UPI00298CA879|nr:hypothetical protein [Sporosarcina sp. YIM B06819]